MFYFNGQTVTSTKIIFITLNYEVSEDFQFVICKGKMKGNASRKYLEKPHILLCVEKYIKLFFDCKTKVHNIATRKVRWA